MASGLIGRGPGQVALPRKDRHPDDQSVHFVHRVIRCRVPLRNATRPAGAPQSQRLARGEVPGDVAMKQPVAGPLRNPRHLHRLPGDHPLGHDQVATRFAVAGIAGAVPSGNDLIVEAVQLHRMHVRRDIEDPPAHRVAHGVGQPFGVGPRPSVDDHQLPLSFPRQYHPAHRVLPHADDEDTIPRWLSGLVDDDGPGELRILPGAPPELSAHRRSPVVVRSGRVEAESHRAGRAEGDLKGVNRGGREGPSVETMNREHCIRHGVADGEGDLGPRRHSNQGARDLRRLPRLGKRRHVGARGAVAVGVPRAQARFQMEGEEAIARGARGATIVVDADTLAPAMRARSAPRREQQQQQCAGEWRRTGIIYFGMRFIISSTVSVSLTVLKCQM